MQRRISPPGGGTELLTRNWAAGCEVGVDPGESSAGANDSRLEVRDVLMTNIKDDGIENAHFMPGLVVSSHVRLFPTDADETGPGQGTARRRRDVLICSGFAP